MATKLMKIKVDVETATETTPTDTRFFYVTTAETAAGSTLTIDAAAFLDDAGVAVVTLPTLATGNSYFNVYTNGVLQMEGICTYTPGITAVGKLEIAVPAGGDSILVDTPIVLEVVNYAPVSTNTITT